MTAWKITAEHTAFPTGNTWKGITITYEINNCS